jgi:pyridoxamine-phosphate oxidase
MDMMSDMSTNLSDIRRDYERDALHRRDLDPDPIKQFEKWMNDAIAAGELEPTAATLATATRDGRPSARVILLKRFGPDGFVFFTNYLSQKGREMAENPHVELCFFWNKLIRTVRVRGTVSTVPADESEEYFHSRPRSSQVAAVASQQSQPIASRADLEQRFAELEKEYEGREIPRPGHWGGYAIKPESIEFWQGRPSRLHDRLRYVADREGTWRIERVSP